MTLPMLNGLNRDTSHQRRVLLIWIVAVVILGLYVFHGASFSDVSISMGDIGNGPKPESLTVYDWRDPELGATKQHMEFVHMETDVVPRPHYYPIDQVHQQGMFHTGVWVAVLDTNLADEHAKLLMLKRGPQLKTCPNTWSLMGEHSYHKELPNQTVLRGLQEELGNSFVHHFEQMGAKMRPVLKHPVLFHLDYRDDLGRMERQITYLYVVEMNTPWTELQRLLQVDEEVAEITWKTRQELQEDWMNYHPSEKFCRHEMAVFLQLMLHRIEDLGKEAKLGENK